MVEELLQLLISEVDTQLLETIVLFFGFKLQVQHTEDIQLQLQ